MSRDEYRPYEPKHGQPADLVGGFSSVPAPRHCPVQKGAFFADFIESDDAEHDTTAQVTMFDDAELDEMPDVRDAVEDPGMGLGETYMALHDYPCAEVREDGNGLTWDEREDDV